MTVVFHDDGTCIYDFGAEFLVLCPNCGKRAFVQSLEGPSASARLVCDHCGIAKRKEISFTSQAVREPFDGFFGIPLWLQTPCKGRVLWACNVRHLEFLELYVTAKLRLRDHELETKAVNKRLAGRLPRWISSAKTRSSVLLALARLRRKAEI